MERSFGSLSWNYASVNFPIQESNDIWADFHSICTAFDSQTFDFGITFSILFTRLVGHLALAAIVA
jgi:hypothetical protein